MESQKFFKFTEKSLEELLIECEKTFLEKQEKYGNSLEFMTKNGLIDLIFVKVVSLNNLNVHFFGFEDKTCGAATQYAIEIIANYMAVVNYGIYYNLCGADNHRAKETELIYQMQETKSAQYGYAWQMMFIKSFAEFMQMKIVRVKNYLISTNSVTQEDENWITEEVRETVLYSLYGLYLMKSYFSKIINN